MWLGCGSTAKPAPAVFFKKAICDLTGGNHRRCGYGTSTAPVPSILLSMLSAVFLWFLSPVCARRGHVLAILYSCYRTHHLRLASSAACPALFTSYSETCKNCCLPPDRAPPPLVFLIPSDRRDKGTPEFISQPLLISHWTGLASTSHIAAD